MRHFLSFGYKQIKRMMVSLVGGTDIRKQRRKRRALRTALYPKVEWHKTNCSIE